MRHLIGLHADLDQHQREFADLRKIDGRQQAGAQALLHGVERREHRDETADQCEGNQHQRKTDHRQRRHRNHHAKRNKEQGDEKIAQRRHLGRHVERVRESGKRHPGN